MILADIVKSRLRMVCLFHIGKSVYCAITVCLVDKDWGSEMDVAVIEVSQDENAYVLPLEISEEELDYFSFDDIMRLAYWIGNFWAGVQYEINNRLEEIRVVEQRGPISPDDDAYKSQERIVLIKRVVAVDKDESLLSMVQLFQGVNINATFSSNTNK